MTKLKRRRSHCSSCNNSEYYTKPKPKFVKTDRVCHPMIKEDGKMPRTEYDEIFLKKYNQHALTMDYDLVTIQENYSSGDCTSDSDCKESGFTCQRIPTYKGKKCTKQCSKNFDGYSDCPSGYVCTSYYCQKD